jgi:predicted transcriptional regulator
MDDKYRLTPVEAELMEILWSLGQGCVHDVMARLPTHRQLAYTSVSTILRILEQKDILTTQKVSRQHIYIPLLSKQTFANHSITKIVKQVFSGNSVKLVTYLVDKNNLTLDEINSLQKLLHNKKKELTPC